MNTASRFLRLPALVLAAALIAAACGGDSGETADGSGDGDERDDRGGRRMSDTVRKALASGFRSVRASEEKLRGMVGDPDGSLLLTAEGRGPEANPEELGIRVAEDLLSQGAQKILDAVYLGAESQ
jgi:hypothetical protein